MLMSEHAERPPFAPKSIDSRWRFVSSHWTGFDRSGESCTIVRHGEPGANRYPYEIAFADGTRLTAVDAELEELTRADQSSREPRERSS
jgi:hypothetical protein